MESNKSQSNFEARLDTHGGTGRIERGSDLGVEDEAEEQRRSWPPSSSEQDIAAALVPGRRLQDAPPGSRILGEEVVV
jgi:hypothetical protein